MEKGWNKIDSDTIMYGVFGDPVRHSKSPLMLNHAFRVCGLNGVYAAFHILPGALGDAVRGIRALQFRGVNVTIPHKVEVMEYMDRIDEGARFIGAVNTIVNDGGVLTGFNTDSIGYVRSLKEETGIDLKGRRILILGAGGAARGVSYALAMEQPETIWIANRTADKAKQLAEHLSRYADAKGLGLSELDPIRREVDLVINTTEVGMAPHTDGIPVDPGWLHGDMTVSDIVYTPVKTRLLMEAEARGARIHSGFGMFIYQGAYAFEYWTGRPAPVEEMRRVVEQSLTGSNS